MAAVSTNAPLSMPTQQMPILDAGGLTSQPWWRFFYGLYTRSAATIPYLVGTGVVAGGTTQADATPLSSEWNVISMAPANSGVVLNAFGVGFESTIFNKGGASLNVYPPIGCSIDSLAANAPYALANNKTQIFYQLSATEFSSLQLG
jgi:hypothetical protein